jgi:hypothetical protein
MATGSKIRAARTDSLAMWSHSLLTPPHESGHDQNECSFAFTKRTYRGLRDVAEAEVEKDLRARAGRRSNWAGPAGTVFEGKNSFS